MSRLFSASMLIGLGLVPGLAHAQDKAPGPEKALEAFKAAVEAGNVQDLSQLVAGDEGVGLRQLAEPFDKAKRASDRFDQAMRDRKIDFKNPFAAAFQPFLDVQFEAVKDEIIRKSDRQYLARVKYGPRGKAQEETVLVQLEGNVWRVGAPLELAKSLPPKERWERQVKALEKLAQILERLAADIENKKLTSKEQVGILLIRLIEQEKLAEFLQ
jgi:hypothetical protein